VPVPGQASTGDPGPETRFEAGDVVVLGEPDSLAAA
jgi:hypothetical protein